MGGGRELGLQRGDDLGVLGADRGRVGPLCSPPSRLAISKDREVAASLQGDTPYSGKTVTSIPATPYTTSVDVNLTARPG
jgi:hypothetical protein